MNMYEQADKLDEAYFLVQKARGILYLLGHDSQPIRDANAALYGVMGQILQYAISRRQAAAAQQVPEQRSEVDELKGRLTSLEAKVKSLECMSYLIPHSK